MGHASNSQEASSNGIEPDRVLDVRGLNCPMPVIKAKEAMETMERGQVLEILASDETAKIDIPAWVWKTGYRILASKEEGDISRFLIEKTHPSP